MAKRLTYLRPRVAPHGSTFPDAAGALSLILLLTLCLTWVPALAQPGTIRVCPDCGVSSLREAIALATAHDTLLIGAGTYRESEIAIDKPLTLIAEGRAVIDGEKKGEVITIEADSVTIDGLEVRNVGVSYTRDNAAIRVVNSRAFTIRNVVMEGLFFGIYLEKSREGLVEDNTIRGEAEEEFNSGNGIQLWYCKDVVVTGNIVKRVRDGIYLEFSDRILIENNTSADNIRYGLHFMFSNDDQYRNNRFENNGAGVAVMFSKHIEMHSNTFRKNWGTASFGLLLKEINDAEITGNTFEENTVGISIEGSNRIAYRGNVFANNGWAIKVRGACYANTFSGNDFLHNAFDVSYNSNVNDNVFRGNFWSDYAGYDLDRDGRGDVPYRPVKLFSYIVNRTPETIVLLRSLFMDLIDFSEKVSPVFTPDNLVDPYPKMKRNL
ncbi:nitrous oxide reductase family maturation protein NosD [Robiginitalea sp. SC105]|uniref:nitrous oxide reductase family maturation protein NosD n=1 Tax=Robiginitalea sp. SC105 TaxID=2762332 RepID=UPI00163AAEAC|nr:nitrous oxide reductase family maturation protein NosD [Robiginitalea sp. SC105]MBC2839288.1 nitrous oxide reductase family maturation protein NosD [Robiginitalea sp. SC105]